MPKFFPSTIFDNNKMNFKSERNYVDVSRNRQSEFLRMSGNIKKKKKIGTLEKNILHTPKLFRNLSRAIQKNGKSQLFQSFDTNSKPQESAFKTRSKRTLKNLHFPLGNHLGTLLHKMKANGSN